MEVKMNTKKKHYIKLMLGIMKYAQSVRNGLVYK